MVVTALIDWSASWWDSVSASQPKLYQLLHDVAAATGQGAEAAEQAALAAGASESVANIAGSGAADRVMAAQQLGAAPTPEPQPPEP